MVNYQLGKIYEITSSKTDKRYIGSSAQKYLSDRMRTHRIHALHQLNRCTSHEILHYGDAVISLLESYPCNNKKELHAREREWIDANNDTCVNKMIPTRTEKERYRQNINGRRDIQLAFRKQYSKDNKVKECAQRKQYRELNKEIIRERKKVKYMCSCGTELRQEDKARHQRCQHHKQYIDNLIIPLYFFN